MRAVALVLGCAIALGGCATRYQPQSFTGGYDEVRLNETTYQITVKGNGYTSAERARDLALLRAADLTLGAGFDRFVVVNGGVDQREEGFTPFSPSS